MPASRPADLCFGLQDDSVFVDLSRDAEDILSLIRISYDGYGCNEPADGITPFSPVSSRRILQAVETGSIDGPDIHEIFLEYFEMHKSILWEDALKEHQLLK